MINYDGGLIPIKYECALKFKLIYNNKHFCVYTNNRIIIIIKIIVLIKKREKFDVAIFNINLIKSSNIEII